MKCVLMDGSGSKKKAQVHNQMPDLNPYTPPVSPSPSSSMKARPVMFGAIAAAFASIVAVVGVVVIGMVAWKTVVGVKGALFAGLFGGILSIALRNRGSWLARVPGGLFGGAVGGFFAIAAAEQAAPGSTAWAMQGVFIGAAFGAPTAALIATVVGTAVYSSRRSL